MTALIFVYGTLKSGFPNASINKGVRQEGDYVTEAPFSLYLCGLRFSVCMTQEVGKGMPVKGELYSVDEKTLAEMDRLERIAEVDGYRRVEISIVDRMTTQIKRAYVYLSQPQHLPQPIQAGPLPEYTLEWASRYIPRTSSLEPKVNHIRRNQPLTP